LEFFKTSACWLKILFLRWIINDIFQSKIDIEKMAKQINNYIELQHFNWASINQALQMFSNISVKSIEGV
jgi:hypothetical protein